MTKNIFFKRKYLFNNNKFFKSFASKVELEEKLTKNLNISKLEVVDLSGNCGTSFLIKIKSSNFNGKTMIQQHRLINDLLKEEMKDIHALQLKTEGDENK